MFGFASNAAAAVYVRTGNQWRVFSLDIPSASHDVHVAARQLVSDVHEIMGKRQEAPRGVSRGGSEHDNRADADIGERHALPRMDLSETRYASSGNGSSATLNMTVIRDSTTSKDKFVVVAKSSYNMIPHDNGLSGGTLTVPYRYKLSQNFRSADATIAPSLVEQFPLSDNRTDINISDTRVKETTYGFNISREISGGLQGRVPDASTKLKFRFDFSRTYKEEKAIAFSVKDYFLISSSQPASGGVAAQWSIELAPAIFGNKEYFGKKPTIERVTPTMRAASPQTFAIWEFDAAYQGTISLDAQSTIENAKYDGSKVEVTPDSRYQAAAGLTVDLGSAYLTRETAVFIRSEKDNGGCLWDDGGNVVLRTCPDTGRPTFLDEKHAQWRFDGEGRYINRGSGQCMQMLPSGLSPGGHQVITARCTLNNDQHWEWRADRIYSLYNGAADDWRLHVSPGGLVDVRTEDKDRYQDLPKNPFHDLLIPWSNYPSQPVPGVFVPVLTGNQPPIPEDWLRFKAVGPDQTWKITALRQSLMP
ncbi:RICIN domain-containing protein [Dyella sp.]|uniref:RICIN domain-containing protein n=1 Tax=Dyella sp. TaxID=1869338 RepID=UPI002F948E3A